jgi:hypothetical protein
MKITKLRYPLLLALALSAAALWLSPSAGLAQLPGPWPPPLVPAPTTPYAQRQAINFVRARVDSLKNATRNAPRYGAGADGLVWREFQELRAQFTAFTRTLDPQQYGANEIAELSAGLDILQESFGNYQEDLAAGRSPGLAIRDLCEVLRRAADVWLDEFNRDCVRLRIGR